MSPDNAHFTRGFTIGSLFSGIGGLELGLERAGLGPVLWQVEIDPFARAVLAHHWPQATRYEDVREVGAELAPVDVICGGFPCQDISSAGKRAGIDGERSGLWSEYARIVRLVRPRFVVVENVAALLARGMERVLGDLAACGYDAEWDCVPASALGAPHQRDRLFVLAWHVPDAERDRGGLESERRGIDKAERLHSHIAHVRASLDDADADGWRGRAALEGGDNGAPGPLGGGVCVASGRRGELADVLGEARRPAAGQPFTGDWASASRVGPEEPRRRSGGSWPPGPDDMHAWAAVPTLAQPAICRLADGLPDDLVRSRRPALKGLGNAVSPPVAEVVGRRLMEIANAA